MLRYPSEYRSRLQAWRNRADDYAYRLKIRITPHVADAAERRRIFCIISGLLDSLQDLIRVHGSNPQKAHQVLRDIMVKSPLKLTVLQFLKNLMAALPAALQTHITRQDLLLALLSYR